MTPPPPRAYTPAEVAAMLKIGLTTVYEMIHDGQIPWIKVRGQYRIPRDPFDKWFAEHTKCPNAGSFL